MLDLVRVVKIHPESNSCDVVFMRDGRRVAGVQCLNPVAGTDFGFSGLVEPKNTGYEAEGDNSWERDIFAAAGWMGDHPVIVGFMFPQVAQCLFEYMNFRVDRHPSDYYSTIDKDGNVEHYHPSGTYVRIGTSPDHVDLSGKDYDKKWAIKHNTDKAVHVHVEVRNAGVYKAKLNIDPSGNISVHNVGRTDWHSVGEIAIKSDEHIVMTAPRIDLN